MDEHRTALETIAMMETADLKDKAAVVRLFKAIARAALKAELACKALEHDRVG